MGAHADCFKKLHKAADLEIGGAPRTEVRAKLLDFVSCYNRYARYKRGRGNAAGWQDIDLDQAYTMMYDYLRWDAPSVVPRFIGGKRGRKP